MYSLRLLAVLACLAAVSALPTDKPVPRPVTTITDDDLVPDDGPWFSFPLFGNLFAPLWRLLPSFGEIGPKIIADDDKFQVIVNVKDYKKDDLKVKVKGDFIFVEGSHQAKHDDHDVFASQFFHTYTLPANSSSSDVTAKLTSDGFLIVDTPIKDNVDKTKESTAERNVTIVETNEPYHKEEKDTTSTKDSAKDSATTTAQKTGESVSEDDRKEPTTPASEKELVTEKDNMIPHGKENEIIP